MAPIRSTWSCSVHWSFRTTSLGGASDHPFSEERTPQTVRWGSGTSCPSLPACALSRLTQYSSDTCTASRIRRKPPQRAAGENFNSRFIFSFEKHVSAATHSRLTDQKLSKGQ